MKKLIPAYILSFVISFMLYINEPLLLYANNKDDLHFNLNTFFIPMIKVFFYIFFILSFIFTIIYFINNKFGKKLYVYNTILIIAFICFLATYIQGNFLIEKLPSLDGATISWTSYNNQNIITIIIWIIIITIYILTIIKFKFEKVINVSKYISLSVFAMLSVALITTMFTNDIFENRKINYISKDNINISSKNNNFYILLLDAVDSKYFYNILNTENYKEIFEDFTYFPDTKSTFSYTKESIPQILSGGVYDYKKSYQKFYNESMDKSPLINLLNEKKYDINIYDTGLLWTTEKSRVVKNINEFNKQYNTICFAKEETKYILFKYLPYFLKEYSKIDYFDFENCKREAEPNSYSWENEELYKTLDEKIEKIDNNYFSFIHIRGAHVPFDLDENFNKIKNGTYDELIKGDLKIIKKYINRLKENNIYDNSIIIIMADHGYNFDNPIGRQNPILFIKGINEKHKLKISDKTIIYEDLMDIYKDLLNKKQTDDILLNIKNREKNFLWYSKKQR